MKDFTKRQAAKDGGIGILVGPAAAGRVDEVEPEVAGLLIKPDR